VFTYEQQDLEFIYRQLNNTQAYYPRDTTIMQLFVEQVSRTPDATAAIFRDHSLTYRELDILSNQVAYLLRPNGFGKKCIVGIMTERSLEMLIGIYGILKSGAAYLPIQADVPIKRLEYLLADSKACCILTQAKLLHKLEGIALKCIDLNDPSIYTLPEGRPECPADPSDLMYVIYTSGSTGNPKGVMVENHAVVNRIHWMQKTYPLSSTDRILQKTPCIFDVSVWELFWWAICGAALCLLEPGLERFPQAIVEEIKRSRITVLHFVPSMFNSFFNFIESSEYMQSLDSLQYLFCSGEALLSAHVRKFNRIMANNSQIRLINLYGPTEATVDVTSYNCLRDRDVESVPIGKPIDNIRLYILDDRDKLAPPGTPGELCIGGVGLARGYLNRRELTDEKFMQNPVNLEERTYRTGDLARLLSDGNLEYLGRIDNQVKIRGIRIELGEIEAKICECGLVDQCVVLLKDYEKIDPVLTAYILPFSKEMAIQEVKRFLKSHLPDYMIPNRYVLVDSFPLTPNGKIDRKALTTQ
jgi:amino acid adenylation domain-containing protein